MQQLLHSTPAYPNTPQEHYKGCCEAENCFPPNTPHTRAHVAMPFNLVTQPARNALALSLFSTPALRGSLSGCCPPPNYIPSREQLVRFQRAAQTLPRDGPERREVSVALVLLSWWVSVAHKRIYKPPPSRALAVPSLASSHTRCHFPAAREAARPPRHPYRPPSTEAPAAQGEFWGEHPISRSAGVPWRTLLTHPCREPPTQGLPSKP